CVEGKFGLNCLSSCESKCYNTSCDQVTGVCNKGCLGYSNPPNCMERCVDDKWGQNCQHSCKSSCHNNSCDRVSGDCDSECNGYEDPPNCAM
ncbi:platelet endothelial aggregation receptor 1, partial [Biomphalaria pfeifferi]